MEELTKLEKNEIENNFIENVVNGCAYFIHGEEEAKQYYVKALDTKGEKQAFTYRTKALMEAVQMGGWTKSKIEKYCHQNREDYPFDIYIVEKVKVQDDKSKEVVEDENPRLAFPDEYEYISGKLAEGLSPDDIAKELQFPRNKYILVLKGDSERELLSTSAENIANMEMDEYIITLITFNADGSKVWNTIDEMNSDTELKEAAIEAHNKLQNSATKKKLKKS